MRAPPPRAEHRRSSSPAFSAPRSPISAPAGCRAGTFVKFYFGGDADYLGGGARGVSFGLPPTPTALAAYLEMLGDCDVPWAVAVIGGDVVESGMARLALERGGHLRVGLEDYAGARQPRNVELVEEAAALARRVGREPADTSETSTLLGLSPA